MSLHKICKSVNLSSQEWRSYCLWRNLEFTSFDSLDSTIHNCLNYEEDTDYWNFAVTNGNYLTDVVNNFDYAQRIARRSGADEILMFDFLEDEDSSRSVGYDILDGAFIFSLLTNFGNDISIVNECLGSNGLIHDKEMAEKVHLWFMNNMPHDPHVIGSRLFSVYEKYAQQDGPPNDPPRG